MDDITDDALDALDDALDATDDADEAADESEEATDDSDADDDPDAVAAALEAEDAADENELATELAEDPLAKADVSALVADEAMDEALFWAETKVASSTTSRYRYGAVIVSTQELTMLC